MPIKNYINNLKSMSGVTHGELLAVAFVLGGLLLGFIIQRAEALSFFGSPAPPIQEQIFLALDSLAEANRTTYIGTNIDNEPDSALAKADTVVEKEVFLGSQLPSKKEDFRGTINLNTATRVELMQISGIGEKTAMAIIAYRKDNKFQAIEEIMNIRGIGEKKFEKMKAHITVK